MVKRWLISLLLGCTLAALAQSPFLMHRRNEARPKGGGAGTPVLKDSQSTDNDFVLWGTDNTIESISSSWLAGSSYTLTSIKVKCAPQEGGESNRVAIYVAAAEAPNGSALAVSQWVNTTDFTAFPGGLTEFTLTTTVAITSGQTNCIVIEHSLPDSNHRVYAKYNNSTAPRQVWIHNGTAWSVRGDNQIVFETYGY